MVVGGARADAVNAQIKSSIDDEVAKAHSQLPKGKSLTLCEQCEASTPKAKQKNCPVGACALPAKKITIKS